MSNKVKFIWLGNDDRAIAVIRVSGLGQRENTSKVTQAREVIAYCKRMGITLVDLPGIERNGPAPGIYYIVETARKSDLRKKYKQIHKAAAKAKIRHHVYYKFDREARNLTDNETGEIDVRADKYVLHYVSEDKVLHKDSPDSDFLMRDYHAVNNKHYSRDLSTKVRTATKTKAGLGWYPGTHTPLGYVHEKIKDERGREFKRGTVIVRDPNPRIVAQVRREFELRAPHDPLNPKKVLSLLEIRKRIIAEGLIAPDDIKNYHTSTIHRRLTNEFYDCRFTWQGKEYRGHHERIIPEDLFWRVQETFGMRNPYRANHGLFDGGWMKCAHPDCGCNIVYDPKEKTLKSTGEKRVYKYYHCTNGKRPRVHGKGEVQNMTEEQIFEQFTPAVSSISITENFATQIKEALNETHRKAVLAVKREITGYEQAILSLDEKNDRLFDRYDADEINKDEYNRQLVRIRKERNQYTKLLEQANVMITDASMETAKSILELATNAESLWKTATPQERKGFLEQLLSNPVLNGTTVEYQIRKPFVTLSEMKQDEKWRRRRDSNPRYPLR